MRIKKGSCHFWQLPFFIRYVLKKTLNPFGFNTRCLACQATQVIQF
ncbi:hypothetical protein SAMN05421740_104204 [Parapedobacter koreensis]|uniref:Uncharacterized protein n=1 Tax=Parapedobacter koreensis TaxID=332977 RepID=A0A1H7P5C4_9SPHI|nr:hypothetical protein SAMN05421740_104204 [Parapedobacter koreensis]